MVWSPPAERLFLAGTLVNDMRAFLGTTVIVTVDRPLGSRHPTFPELRYPINYGYVSGTMAGDGEPIDAYIVGIEEPVAGFRGIVIALVERTDDIEDKLVAAPAGWTRPATEIARLVAFQERFFDSRVVVLPGGDGA